MSRMGPRDLVITMTIRKTLAAIETITQRMSAGVKTSGWSRLANPAGYEPTPELTMRIPAIPATAASSAIALQITSRRRMRLGLATSANWTSGGGGGVG